MNNLLHSRYLLKKLKFKTICSTNIYFILMSILILNDDVMEVINDFIPNENNLQVCNKELTKLKLGYYKFNKKYSLQYYNDEQFRDYVQTIMPSYKLSLNFSLRFLILNQNLKIILCFTLHLFV